MKKNYCFLIVIFLLSASAKAQYTLTVLAGQTYTEISKPTFNVPDTSVYWGNVTTKPDMYFKAFGKQYDLYESVFIPIKQGYAYFTNPTHSTTLYCAKGEFTGRPGTNQVSEFSFTTDTVANEQIFKLQWKNVGFEKGNEADFINFQLWLYEKSGIIEMHYGPNAVKNGLWEENKNGPTIGLLEMDDAFSTIYSRYWLTGTATSPVVQNTGTFLQMDNTPTPGTTYRWAPLGTSVGEIVIEKEFTIYPTLIENSNPIHIESDVNNRTPYTVKLYSATGTLVSTTELMGETGIVETTLLPTGVYIIVAENEGERVFTNRIVKIN